MASGTITQPNAMALILPVGEIVTITTSNSSYGTIYVYALQEGSQSTTQADIAVNNSQSFGPYPDTMRVQITPASGALFYQTASKPTPAPSVSSLAVATSGASSARPAIPASGILLFFDETLSKLIYGRAGHWYQTDGVQVADYSPPASASGGMLDFSDPANSGLHPAL